MFKMFEQCNLCIGRLYFYDVVVVLFVFVIYTHGDNAMIIAIFILKSITYSVINVCSLNVNGLK